MAKSTPVHLPYWMILLLIFGLCGLAVHLATENMSISYQSSTNILAESAEHADDLSSPVTGQMDELNNLYGIPMPAAYLRRASISLAPKLPPPNS